MSALMRAVPPFFGSEASPGRNGRQFPDARKLKIAIVTPNPTPAHPLGKNPPCPVKISCGQFLEIPNPKTSGVPKIKNTTIVTTLIIANQNSIVPKFLILSVFM